MARRVAPAPAGLPPGAVGALLAVRFATEIALLAGAAWAAGARTRSTPLAVVLGIVACTAVSAVWGLWVAPAARRRLTDPARLAVEVVLFAGVATALVTARAVVAGLALAAVGIGVAVGVRALPGPPRT